MNVVESVSMEYAVEPVETVSVKRDDDLDTRDVSSGTDHVVDNTELTENSEAGSSENEGSDLNLTKKMHDIKESDGSLFEKIGELFDLRTQGLRKGLRDDMKKDDESLNQCIENLSESMNSMHSSIYDIQNSVFDLKTNNEVLKRELEESVHASENKMTKLLSNNTKAIMTHVDSLNKRVKRVESAVVTLPGLVDVVSKNVESSSIDLNKIGGEVALNRENIQKLQDSMETLEEKGMDVAADHVVSLGNASSGDSIAKALAKQTRFNTAISLGRSPTMFFNGELHKYVQFVTMFRSHLTKR